jgi:hypothetical protein
MAVRLSPSLVSHNASAAGHLAISLPTKGACFGGGGFPQCTVRPLRSCTVRVRRASVGIGLVPCGPLPMPAQREAVSKGYLHPGPDSHDRPERHSEVGSQGAIASLGRRRAYGGGAAKA